MDEVKAAIEMPDFDENSAGRGNEYKKLELEEHVIDELREFVKAIATNYRTNEFHNFDHAWYVMHLVIRRVW